MAIKTVSQLDRFDNSVNGTPGAISNQTIGGKLVHFADGYLTKNDKKWSQAIGGRSSKFHDGQNETVIGQSSMDKNSYTYWMSLLEISKPSTPGESIVDYSSVYSSYNTTYEDLLHNILWDVKSYLNHRNRLDDFNLKDIVEGDQNFSGTKYLAGNLSVSNNISTGYLSSNNLTSINLSSTRGQIANLSSTTLTVSSTSQFNGDVTIANDKWINGYAKGLKSNSNTFRNVGNTTTPVYFNDGIPVIVSNTAKALSAKCLVDDAWKGLSVGTAGTIGEIDQNSKTVVKFVNGVPVACNEIDYAHHAYWSDVGERYLADKEYEPGTLVKFGGEKEITLADDEVNAIVSTKAFDLNSCLKDGTVICLCGRVPTKVIGKIGKFDRIMLSHVPGIACKWDGSCKPIGRALESNDDEDIKLVECVSQFMV